MPPFTVAIGKGTYPDLDQIQELIQEKTARLISLDAAALATQAGTVMSVNIVLLGALIQTGILPIPRKNLEEAIRTKTKAAFVDVNLKAFDLGFEAAQDA